MKQNIDHTAVHFPPTPNCSTIKRKLTVNKGKKSQGGQGQHSMAFLLPDAQGPTRNGVCRLLKRQRHARRRNSPAGSREAQSNESARRRTRLNQRRSKRLPAHDPRDGRSQQNAKPPEIGSPDTPDGPEK